MQTRCGSRGSPHRGHARTLGGVILCCERRLFVRE
jgi:hypothetical protein